MDAIKESGKPKRLPKPKLPRKRKKAAIKAQGRKWYYDTIKLWLASKDEPCSYSVLVNMSKRPIVGIATDAAHSTKREITEFQGIDLATGERIFYQNLGNQTVNIGEFLAVVEAAKYIIENDFKPRVIYTDSMTAISWFNNKRTASKKKNKALQKAEIFLKMFAVDLEDIEVLHWDNKGWGETPADFGNK